ncbi:hypothetical protein ACQ33O_04055 [Ferruginibacter sp. SUN002]|uniref:hypothetical protein n=1 Tax=Ferruginibacter sp. SUN002 TaxID=2937789 RepID=UPI003D366DB7
MKSSFKKIVVAVLFLISSKLLYAQKSSGGFIGNVVIVDTSLKKLINSFDRYLLDKGNGKKFNSAEYFVGINILNSDDSTTHIDITLSSYALSRPLVKKLPGFYGFLKKQDVVYIFWNKSKLIRKSNKIPNPNVFGKFKKPRIASPYDPYGWEIVLKDGKVLNMFPMETIQKYME